MASKADVARDRIAKLEKDPKHTTESSFAQTKADRLDDPAKHDKSGKVDPKWKEIGPGVYDEVD